MSKADCKPGQMKIEGRCQKVTNITISARRWFDKINGNTYHSVDVFANGVHIANEPFAYGYDEAYLQTAHKLLQDKGVYEKTDKRLTSGADHDYYEFMMDMRNNRSKFVVVVSDVARKKDL